MNLSYDVEQGYYYLIAQYDFDARNLAQETGGFIYCQESRRYTTRDRIVASRLQAIADVRARAALVGDESELRRQFANSTAEHADFYIPKPLHNQHDYRPYQKAGIAYAMERSGCLIADDMGLGKTIQGIGVLNLLENPKNVLIVCPASLKRNWIVELRQWLVHPLTYCAARGDLPWPLSDIVIINYDILDKFSEEIMARDWDLAIVDEFHYLKNEKTKRYKHFKKFKAKRRIALTGTPYPNGKPGEVFTCLHWLDPDGWPTKRSMVRYTGYRGNEANHMEEFQQRLRTTVMVRRLKCDVLKELPPKRRQIIELPSDGLRELVEREKDEYKKREIKLLQLQHALLEARSADDTDAYSVAVQSLRKASMVAFQEMAAIRKEVAIAKVPYVLSLLEDAIEQGKVVVFGHHHEVLDAIARHFQSCSVLFDGRQSLKNRHSAVTAFQSDSRVRLFVGGFRAAGVGITLTASSHCVFAELDWVPGVVSQAEDRIHRIGQVESVLVWHTVLQGSLDAKMAQRLIEKQIAIEKGLNHGKVEGV